MKAKVSIVALVAMVVLAGCDKGGAGFVGTWQSIDHPNYEIKTITKDGDVYFFKGKSGGGFLGGDAKLTLKNGRLCADMGGCLDYLKESDTMVNHMGEKYKRVSP